MTPNQVEAIRLLTADWLSRLATDEGVAFPQFGTSDRLLTLGVPGSEVQADFIDRAPYIRFRADTPELTALVERIAPQASQNAGNRLLGGVIWYCAHFQAPSLKPSTTRDLNSQLFEFLTAQTRISGWRRIGLDVLLEFTEDAQQADGNPSPFSPATNIAVYIASRGPIIGFLSSRLAHRLSEAAAAVCTFALGRPAGPSPFVFPCPREKLAELNERRSDPSILTLARKGVSLDIFSAACGVPDVDHYQRMLAAMRTHHAALVQDHDDVARVLYVAAMESLATPRAPWKTNKMSRRFVDFFEELMPEDLDAIIAHANFEAAFGIKIGNRTARALRRELLSRAYARRSDPVHQGLSPFPFGILQNTSDSLQRAFFFDLSERAILAYLGSPRSSLVGHPSTESA